MHTTCPNCGSARITAITRQWYHCPNCCVDFHRPDTTSTPCHVCADHDSDSCPGSVPECPAFLDSLELDATLSLFRFPVSTRTVDTYPRYFHGLIDRTTALCDLQSFGITA